MISNNLTRFLISSNSKLSSICLRLPIGACAPFDILAMETQNSALQMTRRTWMMKSDKGFGLFYKIPAGVFKFEGKKRALFFAQLISHVRHANALIMPFLIAAFCFIYFHAIHVFSTINMLN